MIPFSPKAHPRLERSTKATHCKITLVSVSPRPMPCDDLNGVEEVWEIWKRRIPLCQSTQSGNEIDAHQCNAPSVRGPTGEKQWYQQRTRMERVTPGPAWPAGLGIAGYVTSLW